jgi:hypothetical protein
VRVDIRDDEQRCLEEHVVLGHDQHPLGRPRWHRRLGGAAGGFRRGPPRRAAPREREHWNQDREHGRSSDAVPPGSDPEGVVEERTSIS